MLQSWYTETFYTGNSSRESKQSSFYHAYILEPALSYDPAETTGQGDSESMGARFLRTFGDADSPQWTLGADWRRYRQHYLEASTTSDGLLAWDTLFGIPRSQMDDFGALTDVMLPLSETFSINVGGHLDRCKSTVDRQDPIADQYYCPGTRKTPTRSAWPISRASRN